MRRFIALAVTTLALALTATAALPASAARPTPIPIKGPAGVCQAFVGGGSQVGHASLQALDSTDPNFIPVEVRVTITNLPAGTYEVWLADVEPSGCTGYMLGTMQTSRGRGKFKGSQVFAPGQHNFQVIVDNGNPFEDLTAFVTAPTPFTL